MELNQIQYTISYMWYITIEFKHEKQQSTVLIYIIIVKKVN